MLVSAVCAFLATTLILPGIAAAQTAAPGFVYAKAVRGHVVVVNWEPTSSTGTVTYYIYRAEGSTIPATFPAGWTQIGSVAGQSSQSYIDASPKKTSTRYWYVVTAKLSTDTESAASPINNGLTTRYQPVATANAYRFYIGPTTMAPLEPTGLQLTGADDTINLTWNAVPSTNVAYYRIYRATASGVDGTEIARVPATQTSYSDVGVEKYRHYWYRVAAEDALGAVGYKSIEKHFRTVSSAGPPAPHGGASPAPGSDTCSMCHDVHVAADCPLLCVSDGFSEAALCLTCHDGTGSQFDVRREFTDPAASSHEVTITAGDGSVLKSGEFSCVYCHTPHGDPEASDSEKLLYVDGVKQGNGVCYGTGCHGPSSPGHWAGDMSGFETSDHNVSIPEPPSGTQVKCSTCHMPHASPNEALWVSSSYRACLVCHSSDNVSLSSPDIYTRITLNEDHDSHHDVLKRDQDANGTFIACQNCHNTHIVTTGNPLVDPEDPSMGGAWPEGPTAPVRVSGGSATAPKYNGFCLKCHDLSLPTAAQTGGWVDPPDDNGLLTDDIATLYASNNAHGALAAGGTPILDSASGYAYNDTLSCMTCHEPHGTVNNYNLRSDVLAADGSALTTSRLLVPRLDASGNPTGSFDTRFFCMSCHQRTTTNPPNHNSTQASQPKTFYYFPTTCTDRACHAHATTTPRRF